MSRCYIRTDEMTKGENLILIKNHTIERFLGSQNTFWSRNLLKSEEEKQVKDEDEKRVNQKTSW